MIQLGLAFIQNAILLTEAAFINVFCLCLLKLIDLPRSIFMFTVFHV